MVWAPGLKFWSEHFWIKMMSLKPCYTLPRIHGVKCNQILLPQWDITLDLAEKSIRLRVESIKKHKRVPV